MHNDPFDPFRSPELSPPSSAPLNVPATPPVQRVAPELRPRHHLFRWIVISIIALAVIGYGIYLFAHPATSTHTASMPPASTSSTSSSPTSTSNSVPLQAGETVGASGSLSIPELGIRLVNLPSSLSDLRQIEDAYSAGETDINLSTTSLTALDANCADNSDYGGGIGSLTATQGTYNASSDGLDQDATYLGQFSSFWLEFTPPQSACSTNKQAVSLQASQARALQSYMQVLSNIQS